VNLGGVKINPVDIETVAEQMPALTDVAACQVERADNSEKLALAYTAESTIPVSEIAEFLKARLDATLVPTEYFQLKEIPRNAMGKVKRQELSRNLSAVLRGSGS
jgi:long-chain acyl-CoA synthetase